MLRASASGLLTVLVLWFYPSNSFIHLFAAVSVNTFRRRRRDYAGSNSGFATRQ